MILIDFVKYLFLLIQILMFQFYFTVFEFFEIQAFKWHQNKLKIINITN